MQTERRVGSQRPVRFLLPAERASSALPEVLELAASCGLVLDDWQQWCLDHILSEKADGSWAAQIVLLLVSRQNGKNAILEALELAAIFLFGEKLIIHSAHRHETSLDHMKRMRALIANNIELDAECQFYDTNGKERMVRTTRDENDREVTQEIRFATRTKKTGRGGSPSRIVFDEALFLTDEQVSALVPSLSAQALNPDGPPQMIYTSSAPLMVSLVLHRLLKMFIAVMEAGDRIAAFMADWGCELGSDPADRDNWYLSNPGMGIRLDEEWCALNEFGLMNPEAFAVERLGIVFPLPEDEGEAKIPPEAWASTAVSKDEAPQLVSGLPMAFGVGPDGRWASTAVGLGTITSPYIEITDHRDGVTWLPARLVHLAREWEPSVIGYNKVGQNLAQVDAITEAFEEAGLDAELLQPMSMIDYKAACGGLLVDITQEVERDDGPPRPRLRRLDGQAPLDDAVANATERTLSGSWAWAPLDADVPICPLEAITVVRALLPEKEEPSAFVFVVGGD